MESHHPPYQLSADYACLTHQMNSDSHPEISHKTTQEPLLNTVHYSMVSDTTQFNGGSLKYRVQTKLQIIQKNDHLRLPTSDLRFLTSNILLQRSQLPISKFCLNVYSLVKLEI